MPFLFIRVKLFPVFAGEILQGIGDLGVAIDYVHGFIGIVSHIIQAQINVCLAVPAGLPQ